MKGTACPFEGVELTTKTFYAKLQALIEEKQMPDVTLYRITLSEGRMLSHNREYLRIKRKQFMFDVFAATFGTPVFISWRFGENPKGTKKITNFKVRFNPIHIITPMRLA